jgi:hypothetical protein
MGHRDLVLRAAFDQRPEICHVGWRRSWGSRDDLAVEIIEKSSQAGS